MGAHFGKIDFDDLFLCNDVHSESNDLYSCRTCGRDHRGSEAPRENVDDVMSPRSRCKKPGPEDPALVKPRGVIHVNTFTTVFRFQVSGVSGVPN